MNRLSFFLHYAIRSLRRDSVRTYLAILSVAFGVLSLVSMQLLSYTMFHGPLFDDRVQFGGDAQLYPAGDGASFSQADLAQFEAWQRDGVISRYTLRATGSAQFLRTDHNGRVTFISNAQGLDFSSYPLAGRLKLRGSANLSPIAVIQKPTDILISRDLADPLGLQIGDQVLISGDSAPIELTVAGIMEETPSQSGSAVFYTLETARLIERRSDVINAVTVLLGAAPDAAATLNNSPYEVFIARTPEETMQSSSAAQFLRPMFIGAGVMGLLIGGISVSNTLQVVLARRKLEIAMLKTLGFRQGALLLLIGLETGMIGLAGGIIGAGFGVAIAGLLIDTLGSMGSRMIQWTPEPLIVLGGLVAGVLTAIIFGLQAILNASATRPIELLRDWANRPTRGVQGIQLGLYGLIALVFGALIGFMIGSLLEGLTYVVLGGLLLVLLRGIFWLVLWAALKLPLPAMPLLRIARASLNQRKQQASLAVMALFVGTFAVTFAIQIIHNAEAQMSQRRGSDEGYNLMIYTDREGEALAREKLHEQGAQGVYTIDSTQGTLNGEPIGIEGRGSADLLTLSYVGEWAEQGEIGILPESYAESYAVGDSLTIEIGGRSQAIRLQGFYSASIENAESAALIIPRALLRSIADSAAQVSVHGQIPMGELEQTTDALGQALPKMLVFSRADMNDLMVRTYQAIFTFAIALAGLAFVAGAVLIANAAGLSVVERQREIGVFKAIGYTSGQVLRLLLSEYALLGGIAGLFGILAVFAAIWLINTIQAVQTISADVWINLGMAGCSILIALASAAGVAWRPSRVRPLEVLRYE